MPSLGFLSPAFLWALALVGVPFLIHYLSRRRHRVVEWGSVSLLLKARRQNVERLRLREILLLVLRTLIVLFLVLALARPLLEGAGGAAIADHEPTGVVMLFDATMSMKYASGGTSLFERSLERARDVLGHMGEGDRVRILAAGREVREISGRQLLPEEALHHLAGLSATNFHRRLDDGLLRAVSLAREMDLPWREVHVFTDLQTGSLGSDIFGEKDATVPIVFHVERDPQPVNGFLDEAALETDGTAGEEKWTLRVNVGNSGGRGAVSIFPRLTVGGEHSGMAEVQLTGDERKAASFHLERSPGPGGRLTVQIDEDALHADDERYLLAGDRRPVAVLRGHGVESVHPLGVALDVLADPGTPSPEGSPEGAGAGPGGGARRVLVTLSTDREGIKSALERGEGLVVFPDPQGGGPPGWGALRVTTRGEETFGEGSFQRIAPPAGEEIPGFLAELAPGLARLSVKRYVRLSPGAGWKESWELRLENGDPVLAGGRLGESRLVVWAIPPDAESSDLLFAPPFIPLLGEVIAYAGGTGEKSEYLCGEPIKLDLPRSPSGGAVTVKSPCGDELIVGVGRDGALLFEDAREPGFYTVNDGLSTLAEFAVNVDTGESLMGESDEEELKECLSPAAVRLVRGGLGLEEAILTKRGGKDITAWFLIAALAALLAESHISGRIQKE